MEIRMNLQAKNVTDFVAVCNKEKFDVNVICGRYCVDGKSVMGVMDMCGRTATIAPVTTDEIEIERFFKRIKPLGAYKTEGFYG